MTNETIAILGLGIPLALNAVAWAFQAGAHASRLRNVEKTASRAQKAAAVNSRRITNLENQMGLTPRMVDPYDSSIDLLGKSDDDNGN